MGMYGSNYFLQLTGEWSTVGYLTTDEVLMPAADVNLGILPKGTWMSERLSTSKMQLASGHAIGYTTQDMDTEGTTSLAAYKKLALGGQIEIPMKKGQAMTLRCPKPGAEIIVEGLGTAGPGNLLVTSGTGAISTGTAVEEELSFLNGSVRIAQAGDKVEAHLLDPGLTPYTAGNVRIRMRKCSPYLK